MPLGHCHNTSAAKSQDTVPDLYPEHTRPALLKSDSCEYSADGTEVYHWYSFYMRDPDTINRLP